MRDGHEICQIHASSFLLLAMVDAVLAKEI